MPKCTLHVESKFGNSETTVEVKDVEELIALKQHLRKVHANDGATVYFVGKSFFEQVC